jgi:hypothetical protein
MVSGQLGHGHGGQEKVATNSNTWHQAKTRTCRCMAHGQFVLGWQVLRERDPAKMAPCGPYLYYLMKGLESLKPFVCDSNTYLWRGVNRCSGPCPSTPDPLWHTRPAISSSRVPELPRPHLTLSSSSPEARILFGSIL